MDTECCALYMSDITIENIQQIYIGGLEAVDDGGFSTVVQPETQNIHLLLQPQPSCQLVKQPHWRVNNHQLLVLSGRHKYTQEDVNVHHMQP